MFTTTTLARQSSRVSVASVESNFDMKSYWTSSASVFPFGLSSKQPGGKTLNPPYLGRLGPNYRGNLGPDSSSSLPSSRSSTPSLSEASASTSFSCSGSPTSSCERLSGIDFAAAFQKRVDSNIDTVINTNDSLDEGSADFKFGDITNKANGEDGPRLFKLGFTFSADHPTPKYIARIPGLFHAGLDHSTPSYEEPTFHDNPIFETALHKHLVMPRIESHLSPLYSRVVIEEPKSKDAFGTFKDFKLEDPAAYAPEGYGVPAFHFASPCIEDLLSPQQPSSYTADLNMELDEVYEPCSPVSSTGPMTPPSPAVFPYGSRYGAIGERFPSPYCKQEFGLSRNMSMLDLNAA